MRVRIGHGYCPIPIFFCELHVTLACDRMLTAIERMILGVVKRFHANQIWGSHTLEDIFEKELFLPRTDIFVRRALSRLLAVGALQESHCRVMLASRHNAWC